MSTEGAAARSWQREAGCVCAAAHKAVVDVWTKTVSVHASLKAVKALIAIWRVRYNTQIRHS